MTTGCPVNPVAGVPGGWTRGTMPAILLVTGVVLSALTEALAATVLSFARFDMPGDIHASPDEFSLLDVSYTAAKLVAFLLAPWLMQRLSAQTCLRVATGALALACGLSTLTSDLDLLLALRAIQGVAGAVLLVSGQTMLLQSFPRSSQPVIQALFALGAVVAPATLTPSMQGWLVDTLSWSWIFLLMVIIGSIATVLLALTDFGRETEICKSRFDWVGLCLFTTAAFCLTYVLSRGNRWDWLEEPFIAALVALGGTAFVLLAIHHFRSSSSDTLMNLSVFRNQGFAFGFAVSFAAGFALSGSSYLIPSFAISVLGMTATDAGLLLLPSAVMFASSLLLMAFLIRRFGVSPFVFVPIGILIFMLTMWMLSGSSGESGFPDMMPAILLRGMALGFLFLAITLITLVGLPRSTVAHGIGLFNAGRQTGGLAGVAFMQTLIENQTALNKSVLLAHIVPGRVAVSEHLAMLTKLLIARGMEVGAATRAAMQMMSREIGVQAAAIAYDRAFFTIAVFFLAAAPVLITTRIVISKIIPKLVSDSD